jgi:hypothetical protein
MIPTGTLRTHSFWFSHITRKLKRTPKKKGEEGENFTG